MPPCTLTGSVNPMHVPQVELGFVGAHTGVAEQDHGLVRVKVGAVKLGHLDADGIEAGTAGAFQAQSRRINSRVLPMTVRLESSMAVTATRGVSRPLMAMGMLIRL